MSIRRNARISVWQTFSANVNEETDFNHYAYWSTAAAFTAAVVFYLVQGSVRHGFLLGPIRFRLGGRCKAFRFSLGVHILRAGLCSSTARRASGRGVTDNFFQT